MYRVLVSSTYRDLRPERDRVRAVIERLASEEYPVQWVGMEDFGALATTPLEVSRQFTAAAELVVLLAGAAYGSIAPDGALSFTEEEYSVVRRVKIPCLAYVKQFTDELLQPEARRFRARIQRELTCAPFSTIEDLEDRVYQDLRREFAAARDRAGNLELRKNPPFLASPEAFKGRQDALQILQSEFKKLGARVAVVGAAGLGKTTLVQEFIRRNPSNLFDPIWLRVDELFGRDAFGRLKVGAPRWAPDPLRQQVETLVEQSPRALLVFDNVQAAPIQTRDISAGLAGKPVIFISWDLDAIPDVARTIRLDPLSMDESRELIAYFCNDAQRLEQKGIGELVELTGREPLLLSLAGRRLQTSPGLTVRDLVSTLRKSNNELLNLYGPTVDRSEVQVRSLLTDIYHCLEPGEREALTATSAVTSRGISNETLGWICDHFMGPSPGRLNRALQLGMLDARHAPDWRGHRFRIRTIVAEFLKGTDAYPRGVQAYESYLLLGNALSDSSAEIVAEALRRQLDAAVPHLPSGEMWLHDVVVKARPLVRTAALQVLRSLRNQDQVSELVANIQAFLSKPTTEEITVDIVALLDHLGPGRAGPTWNAILERLWRTPCCLHSDPEISEIYSRDVRSAAAKCLARAEGSSLMDWLEDRMGTGSWEDIRTCLDTIAWSRLEEALGRVESFLSNREHSIRQAACTCLLAFDKPHLRERLWEIASNDPSRDVRDEALGTLGAWADPRAKEHMIGLLDSVDKNTRARAVSALQSYRSSDIADILLKRVERWIAESDINSVVNTALVLNELNDPRGVEVTLRVIGLDDRYAKTCGLLFTAMLVAPAAVPVNVRQSLVDAVSRVTESEVREHRILARTALVNLGERSGLDDAWDDLAYESSDADNCRVFRWSFIFAVAGNEEICRSIEPERLRPLLNDPDPEMCSAAALLAGQRREQTLVADLYSLTENDSPGFEPGRTVGAYASEALDRIAGKRPPWTPPARRPAGAI